MSPSIFLNGATVMTTPTQKVIAIARQTGYAGIEARAERLLIDATEVEATAKVARPKEVLTLNGVALTVRPDGKMDRALIESDLESRLDICHKLGSPYLLAIPPRAPGLESRLAVPGTRDALQLARDRGDKLGIRIAFEFLGFGDCPINTPDLAGQTVEGIDGIDLVLDSCHWHASGGQPLTNYPVDRIALVHINDAPDMPPREIEDADRLLPGNGVIRLADLFGNLDGRGYRGPVSLETFNPAYWNEEPRSIAEQGLAAVRKVVPST